MYFIYINNIKRIMIMNNKSKIFLAGHKGMVGSAIKQALLKRGFNNILTVTKEECDLRDTVKVKRLLEIEKPEYIIMSAAKVGGIKANRTNPAVFYYDNIMIQNNVIHQAYKNSVKKLLFLGSSCIYPRECSQPMKEEYLMTGPLEPTNEAYALAKIAGLKMCLYYYKQYGFKSICLMPCNLYGKNDSFDLNNSHVLTALVKRFADAVENNLNEVTLWGTGNARREFMHVDDLSQAVIFLMEKLNTPDIINVGWGCDVSIKELSEIIAEKVCYKGKIFWDSKMPDGMMKKCLDVSKMRKYGYFPKITLDKGINEVIIEYQKLKNNGVKE